MGFARFCSLPASFPSLTTVEYFSQILRELTARGIRPFVEIAPQSTAAYAELAAAGACGVTLYQETFDETLYSVYHPRGAKRAYDWRLEALERAAEAGIRCLGLGFLLGLAEPREDLSAMVRLAVYLRSRFPDSKLAFSLPRIRETPPGFAVPYPVDDETFLRMYCGLRLAFPDAELVLSTRESAEMRDRLARICITQLSAGSSTSPGGYGKAAAHPSGRQFPSATAVPPPRWTNGCEPKGLKWPGRLVDRAVGVARAATCTGRQLRHLVRALSVAARVITEVAITNLRGCPNRRGPRGSGSRDEHSNSARRR